MSSLTVARNAPTDRMGKNYLVDGKECLNRRLQNAKMRQKLPGKVKEGEHGMLKILGRVTSINVRKVLWAPDEMGIAYEREDLGHARSATPRCRSSWRSIPTRRCR